MKPNAGGLGHALKAKAETRPLSLRLRLMLWEWGQEVKAEANVMRPNFWP